MVGGSEILARKWASGESRVPDPIADWLEACVKIKLEHPYPKPPKDWRQRAIRARLGLPPIRIGNKQLW
jgi:hypothetical protein